VVSLLVRIFREVMLAADSSVVHHPGVQSFKLCWVSREHQLLHVESLISILVISDKDVPSSVDFGLTTTFPEVREFVLGDLSIIVVVHLIYEVLSNGSCVYLIFDVSVEASVVIVLELSNLLVDDCLHLWTDHLSFYKICNVSKVNPARSIKLVKSCVVVITLTFS